MPGPGVRTLRRPCDAGIGGAGPDARASDGRRLPPPLVQEHGSRRLRDLQRALQEGPAIPLLQSALAGAWAAGFDPEGARQLDHRIEGTRKWVGATEVTALLRHLGVPTDVVDFGVPQAVRAHRCDGCGRVPLAAGVRRSLVVGDYDLCEDCFRGLGGASSPLAPFEQLPPPGEGRGLGPGTPGGPVRARTPARPPAEARARSASRSPPAGSVEATRRELLRWAALYFTGSPRPVGPHGLHRTGKPPLYWQHAGHSRTIIGVQLTATGRPVKRRGACPRCGCRTLMQPWTCPAPLAWPGDGRDAAGPVSPSCAGLGWGAAPCGPPSPLPPPPHFWQCTVKLYGDVASRGRKLPAGSGLLQPAAHSLFGTRAQPGGPAQTCQIAPACLQDWTSWSWTRLCLNLDCAGVGRRTDECVWSC